MLLKILLLKTTNRRMFEECCIIPPIERTLVLYLVYFRHLTDYGCLTAEKYSPDVTDISSLCCISRFVTNNLCVFTWTGTDEYCRAEAMCVILGVVHSTVVETKQKNLLNWLPGIQTDLVG